MLITSLVLLILVAWVIATVLYHWSRRISRDLALHAYPPHCAARQHDSRMVCTRCNLMWDVDNPNPPECLG